MKNKIAVLYGGHSSQYQINRHHGQDIADALSQRNHKVWLFDTTFRKELLRLITDYLDGKFDIVFNNACGKKGGDGSIEGILEAFDIPFVGSDTLATALSFDKKNPQKNC